MLASDQAVDPKTPHRPVLLRFGGAGAALLMDAFHEACG